MVDINRHKFLLDQILKDFYPDTQTTDVEVKVSGLMTCDRKTIKLDEEILRKANREVIQTLGE